MSETLQGNPGLLAVTMGDPAGIGPEIVARALASEGSGRCVAIGDVGVMRRAVRQCGLLSPVAVLDQPTDEAPPGAIAVWQPDGLPAGLDTLAQGSVQAACGAVYSIVPLIQRRMTGQIAGMVGAYGNVGGVLFLTVLSFVSPQLFFVSIAGVSALAFIAACFLDEPQGFMVEVDSRGVTQKIPVA